MENSTVHRSPTIGQYAASKLRKAQILVALRMLGADEYDTLLPETRYIAQLLREDEVPLGIVYGKYEKTNPPYRGRGLLVITDHRILLVDKKPLFLQYDEIKFNMVSGIQYGKTFAAETVTLNTRIGDIVFRTFNDRCAQKFVQIVEDMLFDKGEGRNW